MINSFQAGMIWDFGSTSGDTRYPSMWVDFVPITVNVGEGSTIDCNIEMFIVDRLQKGGLNLIEVLSDTRTVITQCITQLGQPSYDWVLDGSFTLEPIFEPFRDDEVAGWKTVLTITQAYQQDVCGIPFDSTITPGGVSSYVVIFDQSGNTLASLTPPSTYTVTVLTAITDTIDSNDSSIIIDPLT